MVSDTDVVVGEDVSAQSNSSSELSRRPGVKSLEGKDYRIKGES